MGKKTYRGSLRISWTTEERNSQENTVTRSHSETLHASVTKPYPEYSTTTRLYYCNETLPNLQFSRVHTHANDASDAALERKIRSGERKPRRLEEESLKRGADFAQGKRTRYNHEEIANRLSASLAHPNAVMPCIFKTVPLAQHADGETVGVHVRTFAVVHHTQYVSVRGGDGYFHDVPVEWDEYVPLSKQANIRIVNKSGNGAVPPRSVSLQDAYAYTF